MTVDQFMEGDDSTHRSLAIPEETHTNCSGISNSCMLLMAFFKWCWNRNFVSDNAWQKCTHERLLKTRKEKQTFIAKSSSSHNVRFEKHVIK